MKLLGTVGCGSFFTPNSFWQSPKITILDIYFLGTLGDALVRDSKFAKPNKCPSLTKALCSS